MTIIKLYYTTDSRKVNHFFVQYPIFFTDTSELCEKPAVSPYMLLPSASERSKCPIAAAPYTQARGAHTPGE